MCSASYHAALPYMSGARKSSVFAAEGTCAHAISEDHLGGVKDLEKTLGEEVSADGFKFIVDTEMLDFVQMYVDTVEMLRALGYLVWLEQRVSPEWLWTDNGKQPPVVLFGTADCIAYNPDTGHLVIIDLKYGRGIAVEVDWNPQLLYYLAGAIAKMSDLYPGANIHKFETVIVQPRAPHPDGPIRRKVYTEAQVIDWMLNTLVPGVELSVSGVGTAFVSGPHCKFCPALATCDHVTAERQSAATRAFDDEDLTQRTEKEIAEDLAQAEVLEEWVKRVRDTAYEMAVQGKKLPGYKLVPKRATRAWTNSAAALAALQMEITLSPADFEAPSEIKSPAQVLGNRNIKAIPSLMKELSGLVSSNSSGTTLARDDDPREEVKPRVSAADAFDLNL